MVKMKLCCFQFECHVVLRRRTWCLNSYHCLSSRLPRLSQPGTLPHASARRPDRCPLSICSGWVRRPQSSPFTRLQHGLQSRPASCHVSAWSHFRTGVWRPPRSDLPSPGRGSGVSCCRGPPGTRVPHTGRTEESKKDLQQHRFASLRWEESTLMWFQMLFHLFQDFFLCLYLEVRWIIHAPLLG